MGGELRDESEPATAERWIAREAPRQGIATGIAVVAALLAVLVPQLMGDGRIGDTVAGLLPFYAAFAAVLAIAYGALNHWAFRDVRGADLRALAVASSPKTAKERRTLIALGVNESFLGLSAGIFSLVMVGTLLTLEDAGSWGVVLVLAAVVASWAIIVEAFATRYLRLWATHEALSFTGEEEAEFFDFVHLSVQVSTGYGWTDATARAAAARRTLTLHTLTAYVFNTLIVALLVAAALSVL
ncbi:MAG TPA: DUF1345 domain-containing protein [Actinomycetales bacterium]|nr:DUF1345 domain-containing protein [Actinomycetales bacterium]